jgi:hypothetical protein
VKYSSVVFFSHFLSSDRDSQTLMRVGEKVIDPGSTVGSVCTMICAAWGFYFVYRELEIRRISRLARKFAINGYVCIKGITPERKRRVWHKYLSHALFSFWRERHPGMATDDPDTWPCPSNGKAYEDNMTQRIEQTPLIYSENYEAQAILCCFLSPRLRHVSFGLQTHWKLKLLLSPLWAIGLFNDPCSYGSLVLHGDDQAWHIVNWPAPHFNASQPVPEGGHIDSGPDAVFARFGMPPQLALDVSANIGNDLRVHGPDIITNIAMLSLLLHQTSVLYYCETPGQLSAREGMTGLVRGSHIILLECIRRKIQTAIETAHTECMNAAKTPVVPYDMRPMSPMTDGSQHDASRKASDGIRMALKRWTSSAGALSRLIQPTAAEGEAVLCMGFTVHTAMRPVTPMYSADDAPLPMPRVIQNAKAFLQLREEDEPGCPAREESSRFDNGALTKSASQLLDGLDRRSLAWGLLTDPLGLYVLSDIDESKYMESSTMSSVVEEVEILSKLLMPATF